MLHIIGTGILLGIGLMLAPIVLRLAVITFVVGVTLLLIALTLLLIAAYPVPVLVFAGIFIVAFVLVGSLIKGLDMFEDYFWPGKRQRRLERQQHC
jgi:hypothetical protein